VPAKRIVPVDGLIDASQFGFSHCVVSGNQVFIAGQCGHGEGGAIPSDFAEQCRLTLDAVRLAVEAAGGTLDDVVTMTVYVTDLAQYPVFSAIRKEFFPDRFPASAAVGVAGLVPPGAMIEIQATAVLEET
jgi:enamine deaminase RidA (YjgF/YER057c/UK114 family)